MGAGQACDRPQRAPFVGGPGNFVLAWDLSCRWPLKGHSDSLQDSPDEQRLPTHFERATSMAPGLASGAGQIGGMNENADANASAFFFQA